MCAQPVPDRPVPFGDNHTWLAVLEIPPADVAAALSLNDVRPASWEEGIDRTSQSRRAPTPLVRRESAEIFVTPPVRGWTFAVGGDGALPVIESAEGLNWMQQLSKRLGHVQRFRTGSYSAWAKAEQGEIVRAFAWSSEILLNLGDQTPGEVALGFEFLDENKATPLEIAQHRAKVKAEWERVEALLDELESRRFATENRGVGFEGAIRDEPRLEWRLPLLQPGDDSVMMLAGRWSLDPSKLEEIETEPGLGLLGVIQRQRT